MKKKEFVYVLIIIVATVTDLRSQLKSKGRDEQYAFTQILDFRLNSNDIEGYYQLESVMNITLHFTRLKRQFKIAVTILIKI